MSDLSRRLRGPGIALVVLALSAGAVFAGSAGLSSRTIPSTPGADKSASEEPTEATETQEPTEATETQEPTETTDAQAPKVATPTDGTAQGTHGALVSAAAQMPTPAGFANHGAFVSCVAHMKDATLASILASSGGWASVTPASCAAAAAAPTSGADGKANGAAGKARGAAGRARGLANHAAAVAGH